MDEESNPAGVKNVAVEDLGAGSVKLIADGMSVVLGTSAGEEGDLVKSLRTETAAVLRKVESGIAGMMGKAPGK